MASGADAVPPQRALSLSGWPDRCSRLCGTRRQRLLARTLRCLVREKTLRGQAKLEQCYVGRGAGAKKECAAAREVKRRGCWRSWPAPAQRCACCCTRPHQGQGVPPPRAAPASPACFALAAAMALKGHGSAQPGWQYLLHEPILQVLSHLRKFRGKLEPRPVQTEQLPPGPQPARPPGFQQPPAAPPQSCRPGGRRGPRPGQLRPA